MSNSIQNSSNQFLAALPVHFLERIEPILELVPLPLGKVLYEASAKLQHVYFPTTAIISIRNILLDGSSLEIINVGNESLLGLSLLMGGENSQNLAVVHTAGEGYRLKAQHLAEEFTSSPAVMNLVLWHTQAFINYLAQNVVCNQFHSIEQKLCRWLLLTLDRLPTCELTITQELIASMIGVRRESISEASGNLQKAGFISYRRGHISVLDRSGLEGRVCECYQVVKTEQERLLGNMDKG